MKDLRLCIVSAMLLLMPCLTVAEQVDLEVVHKIKQEAFYRSQVMDNVTW
jgi:hypothetical protein